MTTSTHNNETSADSDRELLASFVAGEESSFTALVHKYAGLVMGVCRRTTRDSHYAEDAFQATFIVLATNARKVRDPDALSSWLHGVAYRVSLRVNRQSARQLNCEVSDADMSTLDDPFDQLSTKFANQKTDEELHRLPDKLRTPMILRYTMGKSNAQIADQLNLSVAAVEGRLKRAKSTLRMRLMRHGISVGVVTAAIAMTRESHASVPASLIESTISNSLMLRSSSGASLQHAAEHAATIAREETIAMSLLTGSKLSIVICSALIVLAGFGMRPLGNSANGSDGGTSLATENTNQPASDPVFYLSQADPFAGTSAGSERLSLRPETNSDGTSNDRVFDMKERTANEIRIAAKLKENTGVEFFESSLREAIMYLRQKHDVPLIIDNRRLQKLAVDPDTAILNIHLNDVPLHDVLDLILDEFDLDWLPTNNVVLITTKVHAESTIENRVYPIPEEWSVTPDEMIKTIQSTIAPDSWDEVGGEGSIARVLNSLVVRQSYGVHNQITDLFKQLDATLKPKD